MKYFIAINGRIYADNYHNRQLPRLALENNLFDNREEAYYASRLIEDYKPMMFYGKPTTKEGLLEYARGNSTATYRKRT